MLNTKKDITKLLMKFLRKTIERQFLTLSKLRQQKFATCLYLNLFKLVTNSSFTFSSFWKSLRKDDPPNKPFSNRK